MILFRLPRLLICLLICFNRRRSGEVEQIKTDDVKEAKLGDLNEEVMKELDDHEKHLASVLSRFETRGKRGRAVPVLLTRLMRNCVDVLCNEVNRRLMGIVPQNRRLFAVSNSEDGYLRGCRELREQTEQCGLENPALIRSTKLRKHLGIMTQLMNYDENELDTLARFMGHDIRVHREYYRLPEHTIDLAKVSKHLLMKNKGIDLTTSMENVHEDLVLSESDMDMDDPDPIGDDDNLSDPLPDPCETLTKVCKKRTNRLNKVQKSSPLKKVQKGLSKSVQRNSPLKKVQRNSPLKRPIRKEFVKKK